MKNKYYQVKVYLPKSIFESVMGFFLRYKNEGFLEEDDYFSCYFKEKNWDEGIPDEIERYLTSLKTELNFEGYRIEIEVFEEENWNKNWEESIEPIEITSKVVIKPTWKEYKVKPGQIIIEIDPKMAFGTGHHETTRLCISALEKYIKYNCSLLDMGTGTGIIAIAGVKFGAEYSIGIDNDEWAYENSVENIRLNNVEKKIQIILGSELNIPDKKYDIITSNIDFKTNRELIKVYPKYLNKDGVIILSGLLVEDLNEMKTIITSNNLKLIEENTENEWGCLVVRI